MALWSYCILFGVATYNSWDFAPRNQESVFRKLLSTFLLQPDYELLGLHVSINALSSDYRLTRPRIELVRKPS